MRNTDSRSGSPSRVLAVLLLIVFVACQPEAILHAPASRSATLLVAYPANVIRGAQPDAVRLRVARRAFTLVDSTIAFPTTEAELRIRVELKLDQDVDTVSVGVDLIENGIVLKSGVDTVTVKSGAITTAVIDQSSLFERWQAIVLSLQATCGITRSGAAYCWGFNVYGQLGDGTTTLSASPRPVSGGHSFRKLAHSYTHGCGIDTSGQAWCWGFNGLGELGNNTYTDSSVPVAVGGGYRFREIAVGAYHTCAIREDNGGAEDGFAYCWGDNAAGILGDSSAPAVAKSPLPVRVLNVSPVRGPAGEYRRLRFYSIFAGGFSTCGLSEGYNPVSGLPSGAPGTWKCWGVNEFEIFSDSANHAATSVPVASFVRPVAGLSPSDRLDPPSIRMARYSSSICVIASIRTLPQFGTRPYCWGRNVDGQVGNGTTSAQVVAPSPVATSMTFASISAGQSHSCALTTQGDAYCWGANGRGQLGTNNLVNSLTPVAVEANGLKFTEIMAAQEYTCAVSTEGRAFCWGFNLTGRLGDGTATDRWVPTEVQLK
jgi:alpha-tubulin suppressor-like RCC1 family protein